MLLSPPTCWSLTALCLFKPCGVRNVPGVTPRFNSLKFFLVLNPACFWPVTMNYLPVLSACTWTLFYPPDCSLNKFQSLINQSLILISAWFPSWVVTSLMTFLKYTGLWTQRHSFFRSCPIIFCITALLQAVTVWRLSPRWFHDQNFLNFVEGNIEIFLAINRIETSAYIRWEAF